MADITGCGNKVWKFNYMHIADLLSGGIIYNSMFYVTMSVCEYNNGKVHV